jgi:septal ring factor EnvC (AmiA/AmiB activator)
VSDAVWVALIGLVGGLSSYYTQRLLMRPDWELAQQRQNDEVARELRDELRSDRESVREECAELRREIARLQAEVEQLKQANAALQEENHRLLRNLCSSCPGRLGAEP